ncbi:MAG: ANTAR domain-containing protein [Frankiaceae bacterium]|nr:ANTAR domain-containing protein [Frankiaceae bacterium]
MGRAFEVLRRYARDHNRRLTAVAELVVARDVDATAVLDHSRARKSPR